MDREITKYWDDVIEGEELESIPFPISIYRLVMEAGANRDFNSIHHNSEYAKQTGAPDMYANNIFLQGMWERTVRNYIGLAGKINRLKGFRMNVFNTVGETVITKGRVKRKWKEGESYLAELEVWSENPSGISVGPGRVTVELPKRD